MPTQLLLNCQPQWLVPTWPFSSGVVAAIVVGVSLVKEGAVVDSPDLGVPVIVDAPVAELRTVDNAPDVDAAIP